MFLNAGTNSLGSFRSNMRPEQGLCSKIACDQNSLLPQMHGAIVCLWLEISLFVKWGTGPELETTLENKRINM
jgi:hypothetical protein